MSLSEKLDELLGKGAELLLKVEEMEVQKVSLDCKKRLLKLVKSELKFLKTCQNGRRVLNERHVESSNFPFLESLVDCVQHPALSGVTAILHDVSNLVPVLDSTSPASSTGASSKDHAPALPAKSEGKMSVDVIGVVEGRPAWIVDGSRRKIAKRDSEQGGGHGDAIQAAGLRGLQGGPKGEGLEEPVRSERAARRASSLAKLLGGALSSSEGPIRRQDEGGVAACESAGDRDLIRGVQLLQFSGGCFERIVPHEDGSLEAAEHRSSTGDLPSEADLDLQIYAAGGESADGSSTGSSVTPQSEHVNGCFGDSRGVSGSEGDLEDDGWVILSKGEGILNGQGSLERESLPGSPFVRTVFSAVESSGLSAPESQHELQHENYLGKQHHGSSFLGPFLGDKSLNFPFGKSPFADSPSSLSLPWDCLLESCLAKADENEAKLQELRGRGASVPVLNLDTTAMIAMVSELTNGGAAAVRDMDEETVRARFPSMAAFVLDQVERELMKPMLPGLMEHFLSRLPIACETSVKEFVDICSTIGGQREQVRGKALLSCLLVVRDDPTSRFLALQETGRIKRRHKIVFGTGDKWQGHTLSANIAFVRAVQQIRSMPIIFMSHPPCALLAC